MRKLLVLVAASEGLTGLALLVYPSIVTRLLFDAEVAGVGVSTSRLAGIALFSLAVACWPDQDTRRAFRGMLTYNLLATLGLAYAGMNGGAGILLWPAVATHAALCVLLVRTRWRERRAEVTRAG